MGVGDFTARFDTAVWGQSPWVFLFFCGAEKPKVQALSK
jgi:hypothetical protein